MVDIWDLLRPIPMSIPLSSELPVAVWKGSDSRDWTIGPLRLNVCNERLGPLYCIILGLTSVSTNLLWRFGRVSRQVVGSRQVSFLSQSVRDLECTKRHRDRFISNTSSFSGHYLSRMIHTHILPPVTISSYIILAIYCVVKQNRCVSLTTPTYIENRHKDPWNSS